MISRFEMDLVSIEPDKRFAIELEFVQCLASPEYLHCKRVAFLFWFSYILLSAYDWYFVVILVFFFVFIMLCDRSVSGSLCCAN